MFTSCSFMQDGGTPLEVFKKLFFVILVHIFNLGVGMAFSFAVALRTKVQEDEIGFSRGSLESFQRKFLILDWKSAHSDCG